MGKLHLRIGLVLGILFFIILSVNSSVKEDVFAQVEFMWPVYDHKLSQGYSSDHKALDIQSNQGSVGIDVYSAADGVITFMGWDSYCDKNPPPTSCPSYLSGGNLIKISHPDGYETWYAHLQSFGQDLSVGDSVWRGEYIGEMGNTGHYQGNPLRTHLHFELRKNGSPVNPIDYLLRKPYPIKPRLESDVVVSPNPAGDGSTVTATFNMGNAGSEGQPLLIDILFLGIRSPNGNAWHELGVEYEPDALIRKGEVWQFQFSEILPSNEPGPWVVESVNLKVRHFGWFPVDLNGHSLPTITVNQQGAKVIAGRSSRSVTHEWTWVSFPQALISDTPIFVANICSEYGGDVSHIDIRGVTKSGFYARVEEDLAFDVTHTKEEVCYVAVSKEANSLSWRGSVIEDQNDPTYWYSFPYGKSFSSFPGLAANIVTESGSNSVHVDLNANSSSCKFRLEEDLHHDGVHPNDEKIDWIVWSDLPPGMISGNRTGVTHNWVKISFDKPFVVTPVVIARITTENGGDCALADIRNVTKSSFEVRVEECKPCDTCVHNAGERISWMAVEPGVLE